MTSAADSQSFESEPQQGVVFTVWSWLCLFAAAGVLAVLHLSPKLVTYAELEQRCQTNQQRLVSLEQQVERLRLEAEALLRDPEFAAALARVDFQKLRPGEQRIPVDPHLSQQVRAAGPDLAVTPPPFPAWYPYARQVVQQPAWSSLLQLVGIGLVLCAFVPIRGTVLLHGPLGTVRRAAGIIGFLRDRYRTGPRHG